MVETHKIREVHIEVQPGVTLVADVSSVEDLKSLLQDLAAEKLLTLSSWPTKKSEKQGEQLNGDDPSMRIEQRADLSAGALKKSNILAFKDNVPQLLKPNSFNISDATLVLLFCVEVGLKNSTVDFELFKGLYEDQNLKSGSPLTMLLTNLRNSGYLDKKMYAKDRNLRLTAKGEKKAIEVLKTLSSGS
ncbi:MAG: hypothetical protein LLH30_00305 [Candidatus Manganitrophus sp. SA1]|nr:hypothetical protein [Candidatus Manganitrophus morganii]